MVGAAAGHPAAPCDAQARVAEGERAARIRRFDAVTVQLIAADVETGYVEWKLCSRALSAEPGTLLASAI
jgi:hypothetical protein